MRAREGDFVETVEGLIFDVKGLVHPSDRVVAYVRYVPDESGEYRVGIKQYRKTYSLRERHMLLSSTYPDYLVFDPVFDEEMSEVPVSRIAASLEPSQKLVEMLNDSLLDPVETDALSLVKMVSGASRVPLESFGVSGSIMVGLHRPSSDIDVIVYGSHNSAIVDEALRSLLERSEGGLRRYNVQDLKQLYLLRSKDTEISWECFLRHELRKSYQGLFMGRNFFFRFVKDWEETVERYGDYIYSSRGILRITGRVIDDSERLLTPCRYLITDVKDQDSSLLPDVTELASFRGRFCDHLRNGETFKARGKLERVESAVESHFRILVGGTQSDYIVGKDLIGDRVV